MYYLQSRPYALLGLFLSVYLIVLLFFPLRLNTIESYLYGSAIDGYYDLSTTFQIYQPDYDLPDFSRYHPNHPVIHWFAGKLHDFFGWQGLTIFRVMNILGALLFGVFFHLTALRITASSLVSLAVTGFVLFSHALWIEALSGEVHLISLGLLAGSTFFLLRFFSSQQKENPKDFLLSVILFCGAFSFHLYSIFAGIPAVISVLFFGRFRDRWLLYTLSAALIVAVFVLVYVVLLIHLLGINSFEGYYRSIFIYKYLSIPIPSGWKWYESLVRTFLHSFVAGFGTLHTGAKILFIGLLISSFIAVLKARIGREIKVLILTWPAAYVLLNIVVNGRPDGVNGWLFSLPAIGIMLAVLFLQLRLNRETVFYVALIPLAFIFLNFSTAIYPKSTLKKTDFIYLSDFAEIMKQNAQRFSGERNLPVAVYAKDPVLTLPEITELSAEHGVRDIRIFTYCSSRPQNVEDMKRWIKSTQKSFLFIADESDDETEKIFSDMQRKTALLMERHGTLDRSVLPSSIFINPLRSQILRKRIKLFYVPGVERISL